MKNAGLVVVLGLCAGGACGLAGADDSPALAPVGVGRVRDVAHLYINLATGDRVVTLAGEDQTSGADTGASVPIWSVTAGNACVDNGFSSSFFFVVDDNSLASEFATGYGLADWGDIATDSVVDCVQINWVTDHDDVDNNSDGIGDGVEGLGGEWTFWDTDNGPRASWCIRTPIVSFRFNNLPGDISGTSPGDPENILGSYIVDVDLTATFTGTSLTFEIGDSDGDLQGASYGSNDIDTDSDGIGDGVSVAAPGVDRDFDGRDDADLDGDGLFDWAWSVRFFQPGTADLDGDGTVDGDFADSMRAIGVRFGLPEGEAIDNGDGTWTWDIDETANAAATGSEDLFGLQTDFSYVGGTWWFGGFSCDPDDSGQYTPRADFAIVLYGPGESVDCGDFNGDGELNFFDISAFLIAYHNRHSTADITGEGEFNFFDITAFLSIIAQGCP